MLEGVSLALAQLVSMREREGIELADDMRSRLQSLLTLAQSISENADSVPQQTQRRLQERVERLLSKASVEVDPQRLAHEVALLADRSDVTEERDRRLAGSRNRD